MTTLAPSRAARSAMALPMPRLAPVTKSVLPFKENAVGGDMCLWRASQYDLEWSRSMGHSGETEDETSNFRGWNRSCAFQATERRSASAQKRESCLIERRGARKRVRAEIPV